MRTVEYQGQQRPVIRSARKGDAGFDDRVNQVVIRMGDGSERVVNEVTDAIFVWIPKTGGTSLWHALPMMKMKRLDEIEPDKLNGLVTFGHIELHALVGAGKIPVEFLAKALKFAVVRDPYDRAISLFYHNRLPGQTLEEFLLLVAETKPQPGLYNKDGLSMCSPQTAWLFPGVRLLRFEGLNSSFTALCNWLNVPIRAVVLPHTNQSDRSGIVHTPRSWKLVKLIYADDFKRLGYAVRPMPEGGTPSW